MPRNGSPGVKGSARWKSLPPAKSFQLAAASLAEVVSRARSRLEEQMALEIRALGLPAPEREYRFCERRWRFDFAWPAVKLALEVEGGIYSRGRHTRGSGFEADCEKYAQALILGWRVLRVTGGMVCSGKAIALVEKLLR